MRLAPLLLTLAGLAGCYPASGAERYRQPEPETADPDAMLPSPFTAAQIRDATPAGRRYRFRITTEDVVTIEMYIEFAEVDEEGGLMRTSTLRDSGDPAGAPDEHRFTWEELRRHGLFPAGTTRITRERVVVRAGAFDCRCYSTTKHVDGSVLIERSWFADTLPGAPVKQVTALDGKVISETELLSHDRP